MRLVLHQEVASVSASVSGTLSGRGSSKVRSDIDEIMGSTSALRLQGVGHEV
jgi:hypothetical protein